MPKIGDLWVWRGNNYEVADAYNVTILLRECGTANYFKQILDGSDRVSASWV